MGIFHKSTNTQAALKAGFMGFQGSGKTHTASLLAIGLHKRIQAAGLPQGERPVFFLDTETGADWVAPMFEEQGIELWSSKTRAFRDLVPAIQEAEKSGACLIIDSATHFWRELCDSYAKRKNRNRLQFQDWAYLKQEWGRFTDAFVNSQTHIIICGRAGFEYDMQTDEEGHKELLKTGIRMKTEGEFGFEPSLLTLMERITDPATKKVTRIAYVLKDRSRRLDGGEFPNPTFETFAPHVDFLNLGGHHVGVDTSHSSEGLFDDKGRTMWQREREEKAIVLEEIVEVIAKHHGGRSEADKKTRGDVLEEHFGTRSWKRIETFALDLLKDKRDSLWRALEGVPYDFTPPIAEEDDIPDGEDSISTAQAPAEEQ